MPIGRTSWTDDDGSGTTGTIINNAAKTSLYDEIDVALATLLPLSGGTITGVLGSNTSNGNPGALIATGFRQYSNVGSGLVLYGYGTGSDVTLANKNNVDVLTIPTGTTQVSLAGDLVMPSTNGIITGGVRRFAFADTGLTISFANPDILGLVINATTGTNAAAQKFSNTGGNAYVGLDSSAGTRIGGVVYALNVWHEGNRPIAFGTNNILRALINVDGTQTWAPYGAGTATFDASGNITSVSDRRFKDRIAPLRYGLAEVLALRPVQHGYNKRSGLERKHLYGGFIAQDVKRVMPLAVGKGARGFLTLSDRPILGAAVRAIQELDARLARLEA